jgi:hypothetical protein
MAQNIFLEDHYQLRLRKEEQESKWRMERSSSRERVKNYSKKIE